MNDVAAVLARYDERSAKREDETAAQLKLPPLLEERRRKHNIPDEAFRVEAMFDRILVWQVDPHGETYGNGPILKHVNIKEREQDETPRGVIISAGLHALDVLWGHGLEVGNYVNFVHFAVARLYLDDVNNNALVVLRDGDLTGSEDVRARLRSGRYRIEMRSIDKGKQHVLIDTLTNEVRTPWAPNKDDQL